MNKYNRDFADTIYQITGKDTKSIIPLEIVSEEHLTKLYHAISVELQDRDLRDHIVVR